MFMEKYPPKLMVLRPDAINIEDEHTQKALKGYLSILEGKETAKFLRVNLERVREESFEIIESGCKLCERRCGVKRLSGEKGYCKAPAELCISSVFPHYGEEYFFVPSLTVFFMGCTFTCVYCQNWEISQWKEKGSNFSPEELAILIKGYEHECRNLNLVGGEPTPYLPWIVETLSHLASLDFSLPIIWNSNFYMSKESMEVLGKIVDVYLSDWKYGNDKCALLLSDAKNYLPIIERNHEIAFKHGEVVIRHLVLPGHVECCTKPVLKRIAELFGDKVIVNIMPQYRPEWKAVHIKGLDRLPTKKELEEAWRYAERLGLNWIK